MLPLLTAVVNSIQRIVHNAYAEEGSIAIKVISRKYLSLNGEFEEPYLPIEGFVVLKRVGRRVTNKIKHGR